MGGSLGAKAINDLVDDELNELTKRYDVIHIRGKGNGADRKNGYYPIEFTEKIYDLFACADLAVTRGGGNAIFELGAVGVPMLIIPLPKGASRGDQVENAKQFEKNGLALVADQNGLNGKLTEEVIKLENHSTELKTAMKNFKFDGTKEICEILLKLTSE